MGGLYVHLNEAVTGCDPWEIYSCPVAEARAAWVLRVFSIDRHIDSPLFLKELMPAHPSAALLEAVRFVGQEAEVLRAVQKHRNEDA